MSRIRIGKRRLEPYDDGEGSAVFDRLRSQLSKIERELRALGATFFETEVEGDDFFESKGFDIIGYREKTEEELALEASERETRKRTRAQQLARELKKLEAEGIVL